MKHALVFGVLALVGCGTGSHAPSFTLQLASSSSSTSNDDSPNIEMRAGDTRLLQLVVIGSVPEPVGFATTDAPTFVALDGALLTLAPQRQDAGDYSFTVTASAGRESQAVTVHLSVLRFNSAPKWSPLELSFSDSTGSRWPAWACPSPTTCTLAPRTSVWTYACDMEGDGLRFDVEVVPHGQAFSKKPTFSSTVAGQYPPDPQRGGCAGLTVEMAGLAPDQSYDFAMRVSDEFGAVALVPGFPDGWVSAALWAFDQGPCTTKKCACFSPLGNQCQVDLDCCSGRCLPQSYPGYPYYRSCQ